MMKMLNLADIIQFEENQQYSMSGYSRILMSAVFHVSGYLCILMSPIISSMSRGLPVQTVNSCSVSYVKGNVSPVLRPFTLLY